MSDPRFYEPAELPKLHKAVAFCLQCGAPTELRPTDNYFGRSGRDTATGRPARMYEAVCTKAGPQTKGGLARAMRQFHAPMLIGEWVYAD